MVCTHGTQSPTSSLASSLAVSARHVHLTTETHLCSGFKCPTGTCVAAPQGKPYHIVYDDSDKEQVDLAQEDWRVASDDEHPLPCEVGPVCKAGGVHMHQRA